MTKAIQWCISISKSRSPLHLEFCIFCMRNCINKTGKLEASLLSGGLLWDKWRLYQVSERVGTFFLREGHLAVFTISTMTEKEPFGHMKLGTNLNQRLIWYRQWRGVRTCLGLNEKSDDHFKCPFSVNRSTALYGGSCDTIRMWYLCYLWPYNEVVACLKTTVFPSPTNHWIGWIVLRSIFPLGESFVAWKFGLVCCGRDKIPNHKGNFLATAPICVLRARMTVTFGRFCCRRKNCAHSNPKTQQCVRDVARGVCHPLLHARKTQTKYCSFRRQVTPIKKRTIAPAF